jgi:DNA-binding transcriptional LysR family regulator
VSINLRQMEVFRAVMRSGGVNSAAQLLHVSPPSISKVLAQAAKASGLVLFERVKGRLIPTPEAQRLFEEIERLWDGVERVRELGAELAQGRDATLRLVCTASLAPYLVSRTMARMYDDYPHLKCQLQVLGPDVINEALLNRSMNLGIALGPQDHPNLAAVKSYTCGLACVMRSDHPLAKERLIRPANLEGLRVIASPQSITFGQTLRRAFGASAARRCTSTSNASARPPPAGSRRPAWALRSSTRPPSPATCWPGWPCGRSSPTSACRSGSSATATGRCRWWSVPSCRCLARYGVSWAAHDKGRLGVPLLTRAARRESPAPRSTTARRCGR